MNRMLYGISSLCGLFIAMTPVVAEAAVMVYRFSGTVSSATNWDDLPEFPTPDLFHVGQRFTGTIAFDTSEPGEGDELEYNLPLTRFEVWIGGMDFTDRFLPRGIQRWEDGQLVFAAGGASQGGGMSLDLNVGYIAPSYPTFDDLNGKSASFYYVDYQPFGGEVAGTATITAVPETATWLMMVTGIGFLGAAMRRRAKPTAQ